MDLYFRVLHKLRADVMRPDYPKGFETATSSGRSVQFVSNSVCRQRGPVAIDFFGSLVFILSGYGDTAVQI